MDEITPDQHPYQRLWRWLESPLASLALLLAVSFASYGVLINRMGYYWDDFPLAFIKNVYGSSGLVDYFSTNRPVWGLLYQITFRIVTQAWQWQILAWLSRWISSVFVWLLVREIWPKHKNLGLWISLLFLVYPGFSQQHISIIYSNLFIILDCFLLSLYLNIKAINRSDPATGSKQGWVLHGFALVLSLISLLSLEYFYPLDLIRPFLIWLAVSTEARSRKERIKVIFSRWWPYLALWCGVTIWRIFFFRFQTHNYQMLLFQSLRDSPLSALGKLVSDIASGAWIVSVKAWIQSFTIPGPSQIGTRTLSVTIAIILVSAVILTSYLLINRTNGLKWRSASAIILVGLIAVLLGGAPSWLIGLGPSLRFPGDRFTLPFIFGVSLVLGGLLVLLPIKNWMKAIILGALISFAIGSQFQVANIFRRDWETQRRFFWQLAWRIPGIIPGTTLMVTDLPVTYYSDNSLTAPLNWFWGTQDGSKEMPYLLLYPSQRLGKSLTSLKPGTPIFVDYLAAKFHGSTSQVVAVSYNPPACVRVLDRALDSDNRMLPVEMQEAATLSSTEWIIPETRSAASILPSNLYAPEPAHGWCYYFERADLARQEGNWYKVVSLGEEAFSIGDYPNDPTERFPFIEGYAHTGDWAKAADLSGQSQDVSPLMIPLLCRLWQRIETATADSVEKDTTITDVYSQLNCSP